MSKKLDRSRRDFVKKAAYIAPVVLTLQAFPAFVKAGSVKGPYYRTHPHPPFPGPQPVTPPGQTKPR